MRVEEHVYKHFPTAVFRNSTQSSTQTPTLIYENFFDLLDLIGFI